VRRPQAGQRRGRTTPPRGPAAAIASLGLFLRLRGDFHISRHLTLDRGMFYEFAARELLPEAWRCVSACRAAGQTVGRDSFWILARAVVERMERALRARDRPHEQFQDVLRIACDHGGASGFIAGRAIWQEAVGMDRQARRTFLRETGRRRLDACVKAIQGRARPYWRV
jgi:hypothetical protein